MGFSSARRRLRLQGWRLWLLIAVALYAALGFLVLPRVIHDQLESRVSARPDLTLDVGRVYTNPFTLTLSVENASLAVADQAEAAGFERLYVDFELSSLWHWALVFAQVRLQEPWLEIVRGEQHNTLSLMFPPQPSDSRSGGVPRVLFHELALTSGRVTFRERTRPEPFVTTASPIELRLDNISTLPEESGSNRLVAETASGGRLEWQGELDVERLWARGRLAYREDPRLLWRYFRPQLDFELARGGTARVAFDYRFEFAGEQPELALSALEAELSDIAALPPGAAADAQPFFELAGVRLRGGELHWPARRIRLAELGIERPVVRLTRGDDGTVDVQDYLRPPLPEQAAAESEGAGAGPDSGGAETPDADGGSEWRVELANSSLTAGRVRYQDQSTDPAFSSGLDAVALELEHFTFPGDEPADARLSFDVATGGHFSTEGALRVEPLAYDGQAVLQDLAVSPAQPFVTALVPLNVESGTVSFDGRLRLGGPSSVDVGGTVTVQALSTVDPVSDDRFAAVDRATAESLRFVLRPLGLQIGTVTLEAPFARIFIAEDGTTNVGALFGGDEPSAADAEDSEPSSGTLPLSLTVEETRISSGSARFTDRSLPLPFAAGLYELEGTFGRISPGGDPAPVQLEGRVGEYGSVSVDGALELFAPTAQSRFEASFRNADMPTLSPYVVQFAGRKIEGGSLDLDLDYQIRDGQLDASNSIVIEDLELGEQVETEGAADLPLGLAVALLEDGDGRISVDVPIEGDLGDPEIELGGVIAKALRNLLADIVTSPFRLLAGLVGGGSEDDLETISFEPGSAELTPPELEGLDQLAAALGERPSLKLELTGPYAPERDRQALTRQRLEADLKQRPAGADDEQLDQAAQRLEALESLFEARFSGQRLGQLRSAFTAGEDAGDAAGELDRAGYASALREELAATYDVSVADLESLARERLNAVVGTLTERFGVAPRRIAAGGVSAVEGEEDEAVALQLRLSS